MSKQRINVGSGINTGTGDTLRAAMEKCNNNFDELYDLIGQDSTGKSIDISGNVISSTFHFPLQLLRFDNQHFLLFFQ